MAFVRGLLDRVLLVAAAVAGGLLPGYVAQYRQRLGGRLEQARIDLEPWQKIADQSYQGDLDKLIAYHLNSTDPTFHAEGDALHALVLNVRALQNAVEGLQGSLWHQLGFLSTHADVGLARATLGDWVPSFALSFDGIAFALLFAMILWLLFHALWHSVAWAGGARYRRREPPPRPARIQPTFKP
jgi:hypothetical protein